MNDRPAQRERQAIWKVWHWKLHWQILLGLAIGCSIGYALGYYTLENAQSTESPSESAADSLKDNWIFLCAKLMGDMFLNGLRLVVIPLVVSSIILAVAGIGSTQGFGRLGAKTLTYYLSTSLVAVLIGLVLVNTIRPGASSSDEPLLTDQTSGKLQESLDSADASTLKSASERSSPEAILNVFRQMIPGNPIKAGVEMNLLGLIVVALLVGFYLTRLTAPLQEVMQQFWTGVYEITFSITRLVLKFAPIGLCMLVASTFAENYARLAGDNRFQEFLTSIVYFSAMVLVGLAIHMLVVLPLVLIFIARVNPIKHYRAMLPALITAFSSSSSSATLPVTMECVEDNVGVSRKTSSFVLPLGATVNMNGTALYECAAAVFIVQAFGVELSFAQQFFVVIVALLTSVGAAGVPSSSLVFIIIILESLSRQLEAQQGISIPLAAGIPILMLFERPLDMCRTAVNVFSDSCGAVVVAASEGESEFYPTDTPQN